VTPSYHKHAKCWRVQVPAAESETGKRVTEYFETKEEAEDFITEHRKTGPIQLADLSVQEKYSCRTLQGILQPANPGKALLPNDCRRPLATEPIRKSRRSLGFKAMHQR
jgi:hypothetical protein